MAYGQMSYDPWETPPEERKARFVGREALLGRLLSGIADQEGHKTVQHYLLLGPRGIGKTSILLTVRDRVRESAALSAGWFCVQLREEEYFIRTLRDLLELVLRALAEEEDLPDAAEVAERVHQEKREERSLAVAVEGLRSLAARRGRRILLLIDNFDRLFPATAAGRRKTRPAENEFRAFRKLLSKESFLMVVGASVRVFEEIAAYDQAFFNFFTPVEIPNLSDDEICALLRKCAELEKNTAFLAQFDVLRDKVRAITYLTGGNPRLVVMLYDVLRQHEMAPVVEALRETVGGLTPLLKHVLDDMPRQQSKTLDALVRLRGAAPPNEIATMARLPLNVVTAQLGRLKEARFVVVEGEGKGRPATYRVSDPMFHTWYQMRYLRAAGRRIELFVEFIRAWFSVEERRQFLDEQWRVLTDNAGRGLRGHAGREASLAIQHYAFALEDKGERQEHIGRLVDALVEAGKQREAAMLLAEAAEPAARTERQYESAAYRLLGDHMLEKGRHSDAITAYHEALDKEPGNVEAILGLGKCLGWTGEYARAASELQRVIDLPGVPAELVATALVNRGFAKLSLGDSQGAIADYTAVVDLPGAPAVGVAAALGSRGAVKRFLGDSQGAIADYTAVVDLPDAPAELVAMALGIRGAALGNAGDHSKALSDFQSVMDMPGVSSEVRGAALLNSGVTLTKLHKPTEAVARLEECLGLRGSAESVHGAFAQLIRTHLESGRAEDAARLMARLHEFEPAETPIEQRLEARIGAIATAWKEHTPETAALLLDAALKSDPEDIRVRMEFLAPAIQYARTGDEQALARLPERERDMAKQIAAVIMGRKDRVEAGH